MKHKEDIERTRKKNHALRSSKKEGTERTREEHRKKSTKRKTMKGQEKNTGRRTRKGDNKKTARKGIGRSV